MKVCTIRNQREQLPIHAGSTVRPVRQICRWHVERGPSWVNTRRGSWQKAPRISAGAITSIKVGRAIKEHGEIGGEIKLYQGLQALQAIHFFRPAFAVLARHLRLQRRKSPR